MSTDTSLLDTYSVRIMLGWIASLALLLVIIHLPFTSPTDKVGWRGEPTSDRIALSEIERESEQSSSAASEDPPPPTRSSQRSPAPEQEPSPTEDETDETEADEFTGSSDVRRINALSIDDRQPEIIGGMGSLYLHIDYPEEARQEGIQGRLLLEFTVDTEGKAHSIEVVDSLHPLCDSAAVTGIRSVNFVPAKHKGEEIPVRMRLPVRFQLLSDSTGVETATVDPSSSSP